MARVKVMIRTIQTATFDAGDIPANLIRDVLAANDGTFDGNWLLGDVARNNETWTTESVEIEELGK